jgi:hypothetical protein
MTGSSSARSASLRVLQYAPACKPVSRYDIRRARAGGETLTWLRIVIAAHHGSAPGAFDMRDGVSFDADSLRHAEHVDLDVLIVPVSVGGGRRCDNAPDSE